MGPRGTRPREGLRPKSPQWLAGMRMEPPPSPARARGTRPPATAAADPPLEPPGEWAGAQGFTGWGKAFGSVMPISPSSGVAVWPRMVSPASFTRRTKLESSGARHSARAALPKASGSPPMAISRSLVRVGTPAKGASAATALPSSAARSKRVRTTAPRAGLSASIPAQAAASTSSRLTSPARISAASPRASWAR